jgi:hypothetical protein
VPLEKPHQRLLLGNFERVVQGDGLGDLGEDAWAAVELGGQCDHSSFRIAKQDRLERKGVVEVKGSQLRNTIVNLCN